MAKVVEMNADDFINGKTPEFGTDVLIVTGDFSGTTTPVSIVNGKVYPLDGFATVWLRDSSFYYKYNRPPTPPDIPPKRFVPRNSLDGSGVYQIEVNNQLIDVTVNSNGRSSVNNNNVDEKVKMKAQKEAEKIFKNNFSKINNEHLDEKEKEESLRNTKDMLEQNFPLTIQTSKNKNSRSFMNFVNKDGDFVSVIKDKGDSFNDVKQDTTLNFVGYYLGANIVGMANAVKITKKASEFMQNRVSESFKKLFTGQDIEPNGKSINSVKFMEFSYSSNKLPEYENYNAINIFDAKSFIADKTITADVLQNIAEKQGTVNVYSRVALIRNTDSNKIESHMVKTDGVLIKNEIPVIEVSYIPGSSNYYAEITNLNKGLLFYPVTDYRMAGLHYLAYENGLFKQHPLLTQIDFPRSIEKGQIDIPYPHQINDAILVFPHNNLPPVYVWSGYPRPNYLDEEDDRSEQEKEFDQIKGAVKFTADFFGEVSKAYGEKVAQLAKEFAKQVKGKKLHTVEDALKAYDKYKDVLNKKFSAKDRDAIVKALKSLDAKILANNLKIFSKAFGYTGNAIYIYDLGNEYLKATESGNWRPFFVKAESILAGYAGVAIVAYIFAIMTGSYLGVIGFAFLIATAGALIDDDLMEKINKLIGL